MTSAVLFGVVCLTQRSTPKTPPQTAPVLASEPTKELAHADPAAQVQATEIPHAAETAAFKSLLAQSRWSAKSVATGLKTFLSKPTIGRCLT